jgi:hypothetical protein
MLLRTTQKGVLRLGFGCCNQQQQPRGEGRDKTVKKILSLSLSLWSMAKGGGQERVVVAVAKGGGAVAY